MDIQEQINNRITQIEVLTRTIANSQKDLKQLESEVKLLKKVLDKTNSILNGNPKAQE